MATLGDIIAAGKLRPLLLKNVSRVRTIYQTPEFKAWSNGALKAALPLDPSDIAPRMQVFDWIKQFLEGQSFDDPRHFKRMAPVERDVWEFSTVDVRIFGWFHARDVFIAVRGDLVEILKSDPDRPNAIYNEHRDACVAHRNELPLDEPKFVSNGRYADVISD